MIIKVKCPMCKKIVITKVTQEKRKKARILKKQIQEMYTKVKNCTVSHGEKYLEEYNKF